jgi:NADH-quinone oxidoreductase subunit G
MWVRNNEILRLTPRYNPEVNDYWMSDYGRLQTFKFVNAENRVKYPMVRKEGVLTETGWDEAIAAVASKLKNLKKTEVAAIGSPFATNEDNYLFVKLMNFLGVKTIGLLGHVNANEQDSILLQADKTPNAFGARAVGISGDREASVQSIIEAIDRGVVKALYVIEEDIALAPGFAEVLPKLDFLIVHGSNMNRTLDEADVVLSSSTYAEKHGTITNFQGRVQRIRPAVATAEQDRALDGFSMSRLDKFGAHNDRWTKGVKYDARPTWRILLGVANALGARWKYAGAEEVFSEIAAQVEVFRGMSYMKIGSRGMRAHVASGATAAVRS